MLREKKIARVRPEMQRMGGKASFSTISSRYRETSRALPDIAHGACAVRGLRIPGCRLPCGARSGVALPCGNVKRTQDGRTLAVPGAVYAAGAETALEGGRDGRRGGVVFAGGAEIVSPGGERRLHGGNGRAAAPRAQLRRGGHRAGNLRPQADSGARQARPVEELAGVLLARRGDVGMAYDPPRRNAMAPHDVAREALKRGHLRFGERAVTVFVSGVDEFDADRTVVDAGPAGPSRNPRMPRAPRLGNQPVDCPVLVDGVVGAHPGARVAEPLQRRGGVAHPRILQHQHIDRTARRARVAVGGRAVDDGDAAGQESHRAGLGQRSTRSRNSGSMPPRPRAACAARGPGESLNASSDRSVMRMG